MIPEEIFDVVDADDRVIGQAHRSVVHAGRLLHRAVHIFVFNSRGDLLMQLRSHLKDEYPLCYTSSASGHLGSGETYDEAAPRELQEELGLQGPLEWLAKFPAAPETAHEHTVLYRLTTSTAPRFDPNEIAEVEFVPLEMIAERMSLEPERYSPLFRVLFEWYVGRMEAEG